MPFPSLKRLCRNLAYKFVVKQDSRKPFEPAAKQGPQQAPLLRVLGWGSGGIALSPGLGPGVKWEIETSRVAAALVATQSLKGHQTVRPHRASTAHNHSFAVTKAGASQSLVGCDLPQSRQPMDPN